MLDEVPEMQTSSLRWNSLVESGNQMLDFHMKHVHDIASGNNYSEFTNALHLLEIAISMVKCRQGFDVARFHLRRVQALGMSKHDAELDLHLHFLMECIQTIDRTT